MLDSPETRLEFSWYVDAYATFRALELSDRIRLKLPSYTDDAFIEHLALHIPLSGVLPICTIQATVTALGALPPPPPPPPMTQAPAKPGRVTLTAPSSMSIRVTLPSDPDDGGESITDRDIRHRETGTNVWTRVDSITSPYTITSLTAETEYEVQWRAVNSIGDGPWSDSREIETPATMAGGDSVTVDLGTALILINRVLWLEDADLGSVFDADGVGQVLSQTSVYGTGNNEGFVRLSVSGANNRFTPAFEATGRIIYTASDGELLEVTIANADMTEPYFWLPTNSAEVIAFADHIQGLADREATLTLSE